MLVLSFFQTMIVLRDFPCIVKIVLVFKKFDQFMQSMIITCGTTRFGGDPVMTPVPPMLAA